MTTKLIIETGPLRAELSWNNDTAAQAILMSYFEGERLGAETLSPQQKLNLVVNSIANYIQVTAQQNERYKAEEALSTQIKEDFTFE